MASARAWHSSYSTSPAASAAATLDCMRAIAAAAAFPSEVPAAARRRSASATAPPAAASASWARRSAKVASFSYTWSSHLAAKRRAGGESSARSAACAAANSSCAVVRHGPVSTEASRLGRSQLNFDASRGTRDRDCRPSRHVDKRSASDAARLATRRRAWKLARKRKHYIKLYLGAPRGSGNGNSHLPASSFGNRSFGNVRGIEELPRTLPNERYTKSRTSPTVEHISARPDKR
eukprot:1194476-Prorocentrum_minimum.AAC.2